MKKNVRNKLLKWLTYSTMTGTSLTSLILLSATRDVSNNQNNDVDFNHIKELVEKQLNLKEQNGETIYSFSNKEDKATFLEQNILKYKHQKIYENILFNQRTIDNLNVNDLWNIRKEVLSSLGLLDNNGDLIQFNLKDNPYYYNMLMLQKQKVEQAQNTPIWKKPWFDNIKKFMGQKAGQTFKALNDMINDTNNYETNFYKDGAAWNLITEKDKGKGSTSANASSVANMLLYFPIIFKAQSDDFYTFDWKGYREQLRQKYNISVNSSTNDINRDSKGAPEVNSGTQSEKETKATNYTNELLTQFTKLYGTNPNLWKAQIWPNYGAMLSTMYGFTVNENLYHIVANDELFNFLSVFFGKHIEEIYDILIPANLKANEAINYVDFNTPNEPQLASAFGIDVNSYAHKLSRWMNSATGYRLGVMLENAYYKYGMRLKAQGEYEEDGTPKYSFIAGMDAPTVSDYDKEISKAMENPNKQDTPINKAIYQAYQILGDFMFMTRAEFDNYDKTKNGLDSSNQRINTWSANAYNFINEDLVNKKFEIKYGGTLINWKDKTYNVNAIYSLILRDKATFNLDFEDMDDRWNTKYWRDIAKIGQNVEKIELKRIPADILSQNTGKTIIEVSVKKLEKWYNEIMSKIIDPSNFSESFKINNLDLTIEDFKSLGLESNDLFALTTDEVKNTLESLNITGYGNNNLSNTIGSYQAQPMTLKRIENLITTMYQGHDTISTEEALKLYIPPLYDLIKSKTKNLLQKQIADKLLSPNSRSNYKVAQQIYKTQLVNTLTTLLQFYIVYNSINSKLANDKEAQIQAEQARRTLVKALTIGLIAAPIGIAATVLTGGASLPVLIGALGVGLATAAITSYVSLIGVAIADVVHHIQTNNQLQHLKVNSKIGQVQFPRFTEKQKQSLNNTDDLYTWYFPSLIANALENGNSNDGFNKNLQEISKKYKDIVKQISNSGDETSPNNSIKTTVAGIANMIVDLNNLTPVFDSKENQDIRLPEIDNINFNTGIASILQQHHLFANQSGIMGAALQSLASNKIQMTTNEWNRIQKLIDLQEKQDSALQEFNFVKSVYQSVPSILLKEDKQTRNKTFLKGSSAILYLKEDMQDNLHLDGTALFEQVNEEVKKIIKGLEDNNSAYTNSYKFGMDYLLPTEYKKLMTLKFLKDLDLTPIDTFTKEENGKIVPDIEKNYEANVKQILIKYLTTLNKDIDPVVYQGKDIYQLLNWPVVRIDFLKTAMSRVPNLEKANTIVNEGDSLSLNSMLANALSADEMGELETLVPAKITNTPIETPSGWAWLTSAWKELDTGDFYKKEHISLSQLIEPIKLDNPIQTDLKNGGKTVNGLVSIDGLLAQTIEKGKSAYQIDFVYKKGANNIKTINGVKVGERQKTYYVARAMHDIPTDTRRIFNYYNPRKITNLEDKNEDEILVYTETITSDIDVENVVGYRNITFNPLLIDFIGEDSATPYYTKILQNNTIKIEVAEVQTTINEVATYATNKISEITKHIDNLNKLNVEYSTMMNFLLNQFPDIKFLNNQVLVKLPENLSYLNRKYLLINLPTGHSINTTGMNYYDELSYNSGTQTYEIVLNNKEYTEINNLFDNIISTNSNSLIQGVRYNDKVLKLIAGKWKDVSYIDSLLVEPSSTITFQVGGREFNKPIKVKVYINDLYQNYFSVADTDVDIQVPLNTRSKLYSSPYINSDLLLQRFNKDTLSGLTYTQLQEVMNNEEIYFNTFDKLFKYNKENQIGNAINYQGFEALYVGIKQNSDYILTDEQDIKNGFITEYLYNDKQLKKIIVLPAKTQSLNVANGEYELELLNNSNETPRRVFFATDFNPTIVFQEQGLYKLSVKNGLKTTVTIYVYIPEQKVDSKGQKLDIYNYNLANISSNALQGFKYFKDDVLFKKINRYNNTLKEGQKIDVKKEYLIEKLRQLNKVQASENFIYQIFYRYIDQIKKAQSDKQLIIDTNKTNTETSIETAKNRLNDFIKEHQAINKILEFFLTNVAEDSSVKNIQLNDISLDQINNLINMIKNDRNFETYTKNNYVENTKNITNKPNNSTNITSLTINDYLKLSLNEYKANVLDKQGDKFKTLLSKWYKNKQIEYKKVLIDKLNNQSTILFNSPNNINIKPEHWVQMFQGEEITNTFNDFKQRVILATQSAFANKDLSNLQVKVILRENLDNLANKTIVSAGKYNLIRNIDWNSATLTQIKEDKTFGRILIEDSGNKILYIIGETKDYVLEDNEIKDNSDKAAHSDYFVNTPDFETLDLTRDKTKFKEWLLPVLNYQSDEINETEVIARMIYAKNFVKVNEHLEKLQELLDLMTNKLSEAQQELNQREYTYQSKVYDKSVADLKIQNIDRQIANYVKLLNKNKENVKDQIERLYGKQNYNIFNTEEPDQVIDEKLNNLKEFQQVIKEVVYQVPLVKYNAMYLTDYINNATSYNTVGELIEDLGLHIDNLPEELLNSAINYKASAFKNSINIRINQYNLNLNLANLYGSFNIAGFSNDGLTDVYSVYISDGWLNEKIHQDVVSIQETNNYDKNLIQLGLSAKELESITGVIVDNRSTTSLQDTYDLEYVKDENNKKVLKITINSKAQEIGTQGEKPTFFIRENESGVLVGTWNGNYKEILQDKNLIRFTNLTLKDIYVLDTNVAMKAMSNYNELVLNDGQIEHKLLDELKIQHLINSTYTNGDEVKRIIDENQFTYTFDNIYYSNDKIYFNIIIRYGEANHTFNFVMNNFLDNYEPETLKSTPNSFKDIKELIEFNDYEKYKMVDKGFNDNGVNVQLIEAVITNILVNHRYIAKSIKDDGKPLIDNSTSNLQERLDKSVVNTINAIFGNSSKTYYRTLLKGKGFKEMYDALINIIRFIPTQSELEILSMSEEQVIAKGKSKERQKLNEYFQINPLYKLINFNKPLFTSQEISISFIDNVKSAQTMLGVAKKDRETLANLDKPISIYNKYDGKRKWIVYDELHNTFTVSEKPTFINFLTLKEKEKTDPRIFDKFNELLTNINTYATFTLDYNNKKAQKYQDVVFDVEIRNSISKIKYGISSKTLQNNQILEWWTNNENQNFIRDISGVHIKDAIPANLQPLPEMFSFGNRNVEDSTHITTLSKNETLMVQLQAQAKAEYDTLDREEKITRKTDTSWKWMFLAVGLTLLTGGIGYFIYRVRKPKTK